MVAITAISQRLAEKPAYTDPVSGAPRGVPTGAGDWRLVIERLRGSGAVVGEAVVGTAVVGTLVWEDLTPHWRGHRSTRGAQEARGRPLNGEIILTLDARTDTSLDPWTDYVNTRAGTIIRCGLVSDVDPRAGGWLPRWCGQVESWPPTYVESADSYVDVHLVETLASLAQVNDNALPGVVGLADNIVERCDRLLTAADWRYGMVTLFASESESTLLVELQSTDMSLNRLAELYLTADSCGGIVRSDVTGAALVTDRDGSRPTRLHEFSTAHHWLELTNDDDSYVDGDWRIAYDSDSVITDTSPASLINDHRYARVGGTQQVVSHTVSQGVYRSIRTRQRSDLLCQYDVHVLAAAYLDSDREALTTLDIPAVSVTATGKPNRILAVAAVDVGDAFNFQPPTSEIGKLPTVFGQARTVIDDVRPLPGRVAWTATYAIDITWVVGLPGAYLDPVFR